MTRWQREWAPAEVETSRPNTVDSRQYSCRMEQTVTRMSEGSYNLFFGEFGRVQEHVAQMTAEG